MYGVIAVAVAFLLRLRWVSSCSSLAFIWLCLAATWGALDVERHALIFETSGLKVKPVLHFQATGFKHQRGVVGAQVDI